MSNPVSPTKGPKFTQLLHCSSSAESKSVTIQCLANDGNPYVFELSSSVLPIAIVALMAEHGRLQSKLPKNDMSPVQPIRTIGLEASISTEGTPALGLILDNQAVLRFEVEQSFLLRFRDAVDQLIRETAK